MASGGGEVRLMPSSAMNHSSVSRIVGCDSIVSWPSLRGVRGPYLQVAVPRVERERVLGDSCPSQVEHVPRGSVLPLGRRVHGSIAPKVFTKMLTMPHFRVPAAVLRSFGFGSLRLDTGMIGKSYTRTTTAARTAGTLCGASTSPAHKDQR